MRKIAQIRCPYIALPIPGERPFVIEREKFDAVTRGVSVITMALEKGKTTDAKHGEIWRLILTYQCGRVTGRAVLYNLLQTKFASAQAYRNFRMGIHDWAERQRGKRAVPCVNPAQEKYLKQIRKLERELGKMYAHAPRHPLFRKSFEYHNREHYLRLHQERERRRMYALIASRVLKGKLKPAQAAALCKEMNPGRFRVGTLTAFTDWKKLYLVMGCQERRRSSYKEPCFAEQLAEHRKALVEFVGVKREMDSIKSQIESLRTMASTVVPLVNERGLMIAA